MEQLGINLGADNGMVDHILTEGGQSRSSLQSEAITKATDESMEVYQATAFLFRYDSYRFGISIKEFENYYATVMDEYPNNQHESYHILKHYKFGSWNYQALINNTIGGMDFIKIRKGNKKDAMNITCWNFQKKVHYEYDCPEKKTETDNDADASRQYGSANVTNGIEYATVMLQEGVHGVKLYGDEMFSAFYFFNAGNKPMHPEELHSLLE